MTGNCLADAWWARERSEGFLSAESVSPQFRELPYWFNITAAQGMMPCMSIWTFEPSQPAERIVRLCERARVCGEQYVFVSGRWVLGSEEAEREASLALLARLRLFLIIADEHITLTPDGQELHHHRPRPWEDE